MKNSGKIYICATPIGNLGDCSLRLLECLKAVDIIYSEDTRVAKKLLLKFSINKPIKRLDENVMNKLIGEVLEHAKNSKKIAYISDAGMPGVSDPGLKLVSAAREAGITIEVLPGPSAAITAYVVSGFNNPKFYFGGFFPRKIGEQTVCLEELKNLDAILIFYESPKRLLVALKSIAQIMPNNKVSVCRELTKLHEEVSIGTAVELLEDFLNRESIKGEIVICIDNKPFVSKTDMSIENLAKLLTDKELKTKDVAQALTCAFGISNNEAYDIALSQK